MKVSIKIITVSLLALSLWSCGDDSTTEPGEQSWGVRYKAINETGSDLIVGLSGPATSGATSVEYSVPAGETVDLLAYESSLKSVPEVENDLWCVSVLLERDRILVHQLCPVSSDQWVVTEPSSRQTEFGLVIAESDLDPIEDRCPRLAGVVFESTTGNAIPGATVAYLGTGTFSLPTNSRGRYLFYLPEGPLQGVVTVSLEGYQSAEHALPDGITGNSFGLYRLDFGLMGADLSRGNE